MYVMFLYTFKVHKTIFWAENFSLAFNKNVVIAITSFRDSSLSIHFFQSHPSSKNRKHITGYSLNGVNIQKNLRISISGICLTPYLIKKKKMQKSLYVVFYHKDKNTRLMKHLSYSLLFFLFLGLLFAQMFYTMLQENCFQ